MPVATVRRDCLPDRGRGQSAHSDSLAGRVPLGFQRSVFHCTTIASRSTTRKLIIHCCSGFPKYSVSCKKGRQRRGTGLLPGKLVIICRGRHRRRDGRGTRQPALSDRVRERRYRRFLRPFPFQSSIHCSAERSILAIGRLREHGAAATESTYLGFSGFCGSCRWRSSVHGGTVPTERA